MTYLDIKNLPQGPQELVVGGPPKMYSRKFAIIPFYRDESNSEISRAKRHDEAEYLQLKPLLPK